MRAIVPLHPHRERGLQRVRGRGADLFLRVRVDVAADRVFLKCSVTITVTFGHFSLNGYAKHGENRYFLKFVNQIWPKVTVISSRAAVWKHGRAPCLAGKGATARPA